MMRAIKNPLKEHERIHVFDNVGRMKIVLIAKKELEVIIGKNNRVRGHI